ncbi:MAG: rhodanese-like domain-containing protein [Bacteroidota bacterium]
MLTFFKNLFSREKNYEDLTPDEFKARMKQGAKEIVILDVRSQGEVAQGKIRGARNIDIMRPDFKEKVQPLPKDKTYLVYCRSGRRSAKACNTMHSLGFDKVANLKGGYLAWDE